MSKKLDTIWEIAPHTLAKHAILQRYLEAWLPIMTSWSGRVVYIDGFAGPGRYKGGEVGSPVIALTTARDHRVKIKAEVVFWFVEKEEPRYDHLVQIVKSLEPSLPKNFKCQCALGTFDEQMTQILDHLKEQQRRIAPSLVFIDPFGFSHTPFAMIKRIMQNPRCEVLITFVYEQINRFLAHPDQAANHDLLFGTDEWRKVLPIQEPEERHRTIHDIYRDQLLKAGITYVRSFEMLNERNRTGYFLFFGTNDLRGLEKMKEAMWKADPSGKYQFSDYTQARGTLTLFGDEPDYPFLKELLLAEYAKEEAEIGEIEDFVVAKTPFLRSHIRKKVLKPMEETEEIAVVGSKAGRRRGTFPRGTKIKFL